MPADTDIGYFSQERRDILSRVPASCRTILDVGCGAGVLGAALVRDRGATVYGLEKNPRMAAEAGTKLTRVFTGDMESGILEIAPGSLDCVIYGDVLEHAVDPWAVLRAHRRLVRAGGYLVASIPNVGHYRVVKRLLRGQWRYTDSGTMDRTHLRFFTLEGMREMIEGAGFDIVGIHRNRQCGAVMGALERMTCGALRELVTSQYIIVARAGGEAAIP